MPDFTTQLNGGVPGAGDIFPSTDIVLPPRRDAANTEALKDALVRKLDGSMTFRGFRLTPTGLVVEQATDYDDWLDMGYTLRGLDASLSWLIGDWLIYGEREYGQTYPQLAEMLGLEVKTLYDWRYVAAAVHFSVRTEKLSWSHHKLVAGLSADLQAEWLAWADRTDVKIGDMRAALAAWRAENNQTISKKPPALLTKEQAQTFKDMAKWAKLSPVRLKQTDRAALLAQIDEAQGVLDALRQQITEGD